MTCRYARSLLDAFIDSELSPEDNKQLTLHLSECEKCRTEFESSNQLRDILTQKPLPEPVAGYWEEVTSIILARTVANIPEPPHDKKEFGSGSAGGSILMRPLISVIASLGLLFAALFMGANKNLFAPIANSPVVQEQSLTAGIWMINGDSRYAISPEDESMLTRGILLMAPPGPLSRFDAASAMLSAK